MNISEKIAQGLLSVKAVFFRPDEPFTWASGIKSPVYCDNRLTLTAPEVRNDVENALAETIKKEYPELRKELWKEMFWSRSFCLLTTGGVTIDIIRNYIETQGERNEHKTQSV